MGVCREVGLVTVSHEKGRRVLPLVGIEYVGHTTHTLVSKLVTFV